MATKIPTASRNAAANGAVDLLDAGTGAGYVNIYSGTQPASANDAATGTLLATLTLNDPAFGAAAVGVKTCAVTPEVTTTGITPGVAGWFRGFDSAAAVVIDGECGAVSSGAEMELSNTSIATGQIVTLVSWTVTMPAA